jgi:hypothetical protein
MIIEFLFKIVIMFMVQATTFAISHHQFTIVTMLIAEATKVIFSSLIFLCTVVSLQHSGRTLRHNPETEGSNLGTRALLVLTMEQRTLKKCKQLFEY